VKIEQFSDLEFDDDTGFATFMLWNGLTHDSLYHTTMEQKGIAVPHFPVYDYADTDEGFNAWLQNHADMHVSLDNIWNLGAPPDLSRANFRDPSAFAAWMQDHAAHHVLLSQITGVF